MSAMNIAVVTATEPLVSGVVQVTIAFEKPFSFEPGQYVSVHYEDGASRAYCIASAPQRPGAVQLAVRLGSGAGSSALRELHVGDKIDVEGPEGNFVLPRDDRREIVFIGGDVGIAPIRSLVLHMRASGDPRRITVLYDSSSGEVVYEADFRGLGASGAIRYMQGAVEDMVPEVKESLRDATVMVAGYDPFLQRAFAVLEAAGVTRSAIKAESFGTLR